MFIDVATFFFLNLSSIFVHFSGHGFQNTARCNLTVFLYQLFGDGDLVEGPKINK